MEYEVPLFGFPFFIFFNLASADFFAASGDLLQP